MRSSPLVPAVCLSALLAGWPGIASASQGPYAEFRLKDRSLHDLEAEEFVRLVIEHGGARKALVQQNRRDRATAYWADEAAPKVKDALYGNWMDKLQRLNVLAYVPEDLAPKGLQPVLTLTLHDATGERDKVLTEPSMYHAVAYSGNTLTAFDNFFSAFSHFGLTF